MSEVLHNRAELIRFVDEANKKLWHLINAPEGFDPEKLFAEIMEKSEQADYRFGKAWCLLNAGRGAFLLQHDAGSGLDLIAQALTIFKELDNKKWIANTYLVQSIINNTVGNKEVAMYSMLRGIDHYEHGPENESDREMAYYFAGTIYKDLGKFEEAEAFYLKGLANDKVENAVWVGRIQTSLSGIYTHQGKYREAMEIGSKALEVFRKENNYVAESRALTDLGIIQKRMGEHAKALELLLEGLAIREKHNVKQFILTSQLEIAELLTETGRSTEAISYLKKAESLALGINMTAKLASIYEKLAQAHKLQEDHKLALFYFEKYLGLTLRLQKSETEKRFAELQNNLQLEKEQEVERIRNVELKNAYLLISEKQKEILDSIHYAKRIQQCLLPKEKLINSLLERASKGK